MNSLNAEYEALSVLTPIDITTRRQHGLPRLAAMATEALAVCESMFPELALLDVNLRDGGKGADVARALRERWGVPQALDDGFV